ncbi:MAG: CAP domain-containing protein [Methylacidiphilales bacterium]|nr:CAP domain-containing protein [Candidatus Methylacidiphilales bacterium]
MKVGRLGCLIGITILGLSKPAAADIFSQVLVQINQERAKAGLAEVVLDENLNRLAGEWAAEVGRRDALVHRSDILKLEAEYGYSYMNENLYFSSAEPSPARMVAAWMNSPGHRRNLLNAQIDRIGLGMGKSATGYYVVFNGAVHSRQ